MNSLSNELRGVIESRLRSSNPREIIAIASALCAQELEIPGAVHARGPQPALAASGPRFTVTDDTVLDNTTGLMWTRNSVGGKRMAWKDAAKFCASLDHGGYQDWRLPTIKELLSIVDYSRISPSIDTEAFQCEASWYWTSTPYAGSPAGGAWLVYFSSGYSSWLDQDSELYVRAVRAGQIIGSLV